VDSVSAVWAPRPEEVNHGGEQVHDHGHVGDRHCLPDSSALAWRIISPAPASGELCARSGLLFVAHGSFVIGALSEGASAATVGPHGPDPG
jgi:hypothetical protein